MDIRYFKDLSFFMYKDRLDIPREIMPQIRNDKLESFLDELPCNKRQYAVGAMEIKPTQDTYLQEKVEQKKAYFQNTEECHMKTLIISKDMYLLDGHHNWLGFLRSERSEQLVVQKVNMTMAELLLRASNYEYSTVQSYEELAEQVKKDG